MILKPDKTTFSEADHVELRGRVKALLGPGLSQADVAREADISPSTLSEYLRDRYPGDRNAIAAQLNKWLTARERFAQARARIPVSPVYQPLETSIEIETYLTYARTAGRMVTICGNPGVSKTSTATQFAHADPRAWIAAMDPSTRGVNTCLVAILDAMGRPDARGTPQGLARQIITEALRSECLIIVDEAQHLSDQSIEQLRAINDRVRSQGGRCGIVLMGNQSAYSKIAHDGSRPAFAQVSSRMAQRRWILNPRPADVAVMAEAWAAANGEVLTGPALKFCQDIAQRPGGLRNVEMTMEAALMAAWGVDAALDVEHLQWAFDGLSGVRAAA